MIPGTVYHIRLVSNEELLAYLFEEREQDIHVKIPMKIAEAINPMTGHSQVLLMKYLPWSNDQSCNIQKDHIMATSEVHPEVAKFYKNTVAYQAIHTEPETFKNMAQANKYLSQMLSEESVAFTMAAKFLNVDLSQINYERPN